MPEMIHARDTYCSYCGNIHFASTYPKTCEHCHMTTYLTPSPVGVGLVTINDSLLVVRRGIAPFIGEWALPSGYLEFDETWEEGIAREILEETGIIVNPYDIDLAGDGVNHRAVRTADGKLLIFGICKPQKLPEPITFKFDEKETMEVRLIKEPIKLCFPMHQTMMDWYFST